MPRAILRSRLLPPLAVRVSRPSAGAWSVLALALAAAVLAVRPAEAQPREATPYSPDSCVTEALISQDDVDGFKKKERAFKDALKEDRVSPGVRDRLTVGADYYVYSLTLPDRRAEAVREIPDLIRQIDLFSRPATRDEINALLVEKLSEVLQQCEFATRLGAVTFLMQLNETEYDAKTGTLPKPYWPAGPVLASVLENPDETAAVKIAAAQGIGRLFTDGDPPANVEDDIFRRTVEVLRQTLSGELPPVNAGKHADALVVELIQTLGRYDAPTNLRLEPIGVETLLEIFLDESQTDFVRAQALYAISTTPLYLDDRFQLEPLVTAQMRFARRFLDRYNEDPRYWSNRWVVAYLYLSFKPATPEEAEEGHGWLAMTTPTKKQSSPFRSSGTYVQTALDTIKPVFQTVVGQRPLEQPKIEAAAIEAIDAWLTENASDQPVHPAIGKLEFQSAPAEAAATAAAP